MFKVKRLKRNKVNEQERFIANNYNADKHKSGGKVKMKKWYSKNVFIGPKKSDSMRDNV